MTQEHDFGGNWTDRKLDVLRKYLTFFTTALRKQRFYLMYIDGFAGTGGRLVEKMFARGSPLFGTSEQSERVDVPGSARIALETKPPFQRMVLIERPASVSQRCNGFARIIPILRSSRSKAKLTKLLCGCAGPFLGAYPHRGGTECGAFFFLTPSA